MPISLKAKKRGDTFRKTWDSTTFIFTNQETRTFLVSSGSFFNGDRHSQELSFKGKIVLLNLLIPMWLVPS